jgi:hypothetical protein
MLKCSLKSSSTPSPSLTPRLARLLADAERLERVRPFAVDVVQALIDRMLVEAG